MLDVDDVTTASAGMLEFAEIVTPGEILAPEPTVAPSPIVAPEPTFTPTPILTPLPITALKPTEVPSPTEDPVPTTAPFQRVTFRPKTASGETFASGCTIDPWPWPYWPYMDPLYICGGTPSAER
jgi:hypothetical protein